MSVGYYGFDGKRYISSRLSRDRPAIGGPSGLDLLCALSGNASREQIVGRVRELFSTSPFNTEIIDKAKSQRRELFYAYKEFGRSAIVNAHWERIEFKVAYAHVDDDRTLTISLRAGLSPRNRRDELKNADPAQYRGAVTRRLNDVKGLECFEE
jgi:hypothetical protein